jgi:hypothetical protein
MEITLKCCKTLVAQDQKKRNWLVNQEGEWRPTLIWGEDFKQYLRNIGVERWKTRKML